MAKVLADRMTAEVDGDFAVFLIGMRMNRLWKVWKWWPVVSSMTRMLKELSKRPELGLMQHRIFFTLREIMVVQYWRSFDQLHDYAVNVERGHLPAWKAFNNEIGLSGDVGIWHETFLVPAGRYEAIYGNMPPCGLGKAGRLAPTAGKRRSAKGRLEESDGRDQPVTLLVAEEIDQAKRR